MADIEQEGLTVSTPNVNITSGDTNVTNLGGNSDGQLDGLKEIVKEPIETKISELPTEFVSTVEKVLEQIGIISADKTKNKENKKPRLQDKFDNTAGKSKPSEEDIKKLPAIHSLGFLYLGDKLKSILKNKGSDGQTLQSGLSDQPKEKTNFFSSMKAMLDKINPVRTIKDFGSNLKTQLKNFADKFNPFTKLKGLFSNIFPFNKKSQQKTNIAGVLIFAGDVGKNADAMKSMMKALKYIEKIKTPNIQNYNKAKNSMTKVIKDMEKIDKQTKIKSVLSVSAKFKEIGKELIKSLKNIIIVSTLANPIKQAMKIIGEIKGKTGTGLFGELLSFSSSTQKLGQNVNLGPTKKSIQTIREITSSFKLIAGNLILIGMLAIPAALSIKLVNKLGLVSSTQEFIAGLSNLAKIKINYKNLVEVTKAVGVSIGLFAGIMAASILAIPAGVLGSMASAFLPGSEQFLVALQPVVKAANKLKISKNLLQLGLIIPFFGILTIAAILAVPAGLAGAIGAIAMFGVELFVRGLIGVAKLAEKNRKAFFSLTLSALAILGAISLLAITMFIMNTTLSVPNILLGLASLATLAIFIGAVALVGLLAKICLKPMLNTLAAAALLALTALALYAATELLNRTDAQLLNSLKTLGICTLLMALIAVVGLGAQIALPYIAAFTLSAALLALSALALNVAINNLAKVEVNGVLHGSAVLGVSALLMLAAAAAGIVAVAAAPGALALTLAAGALALAALPLAAAITNLQKIDWSNILAISGGLAEVALMMAAAGLAGVASLIAMPGIASLGLVALEFEPVAISLNKCLVSLSEINWSNIKTLKTNVDKLPGIFKDVKKAAKEIDDIKLSSSKARDISLGFESINKSLQTLNDVLKNDLSIADEGLKINDSFITPLKDLQGPADNINNLAKGFKNLNSDLKKFAKDSKDSVKILKDLSKFKDSVSNLSETGAMIKDAKTKSSQQAVAYAGNQSQNNFDSKELFDKLDLIANLLKEPPASWSRR